MAIEMIKLNLIPDGKPPVIHCKQFDVAREFRVCVFEGSKPYIFTNETVELDVRKKDTTLVSVDLEVESGKHYIDVTTTEQMCTLTGKHEAEIRIYSDALHTQEIGSLSFFIQVTKSVVNGGLVSESEVTNLQRQVHDQVVIELRDHGAEDTGYNNAYSGLDATNVQSAIDEVNDKVDNIPTIDAYTKEEADDKFATKNDLTANNVSFNNEDTDLEATNTEDAIKEVDSKVNEKADTSSLAEVATSGSYNDLTDKPTIPEQVQSDWNEEDNTKPDYIKNKPDLSKVATSGNYNDLSNKPTIPAPQVNSDWNANSGVSQILNKPNLSTVATTGDYNDLLNKPSVAVIDDTQASASKVYSSNKVNGLLENKASASDLETLAGVVDTKASKTYVDTELNKKADKVTTYTKTQTDNLVSPKADKSYVDTQLASKANSADVYDKTQTYSKTETDNLLSAKADSNNVYSKSDVDTALAGKADKADTYTKSEVDTALENKADKSTTYTKQETDTLLSGKADKSDTYTKEQVDDIVYNILPDDTASGSVANFNTSLALPMEIVADVNATQEAGTPTPSTPKAISGVSEVNVFHRGNNLLNLSRTNIITSATSSGTTPRTFTENDIWVGITRTNVFHNDYILSYTVGSDYVTLKNNNGGYGIGFPIKCKPSTNYVTSSNSTYSLGKGFFDADGNYLSNTENATFTTPSNCYWLLLVFPASANTERTYANPQIEVGSTASDYHAYNGTTQIINLGGTYYGCYVSQDKNGHRQLVDNGYKNETLLSDIVWHEDSGRSGVFYGTVPSNYPARARSSDIKNCSVFKATNPAPTTSDDLYISGKPSYSGAIIFFRNSAWTGKTSEEIQSLLVGASVVYELATPTYIDLTDGEPITALVGVNNVYADSGDIEVTYKKSIDDAIAELQALILS